MSRIQDQLNQSELVTVIEYSGRGMGGRSCVGITGTQLECAQAMADCINAMLDEVVDAADDTIQDTLASDMHEDVQTIFKYQLDDMGNNVVCYWPDLEYEDPANDIDPDELDANGVPPCPESMDGQHRWTCTHIAKNDEPSTYKCMDCGAQYED